MMFIFYAAVFLQKVAKRCIFIYSLLVLKKNPQKTHRIKKHFSFTI